MKLFSFAAVALFALSFSTPAFAAEEGETLKLGEDGTITLVAPKTWTKRKPAINFIQY